MDKYRVTFMESDKKLTKEEIRIVREIMANIMAKDIVKNRRK